MLKPLAKINIKEFIKSLTQEQKVVMEASQGI